MLFAPLSSCPLDPHGVCLFFAISNSMATYTAKMWYSRLRMICADIYVAYEHNAFDEYFISN